MAVSSLLVLLAQWSAATNIVSDISKNPPILGGFFLQMGVLFGILTWHTNQIACGFILGRLTVFVAVLVEKIIKCARSSAGRAFD